MRTTVITNDSVAPKRTTTKPDRPHQQVLYSTAVGRITEANSDPEHRPIMLGDVLSEEEYRRFIESDPGFETDEDLFE